MTEDKSQSVSHTLRFHGNQYDPDTLKSSDAPLQIFVRQKECESEEEAETFVLGNLCL